MRFELSMKQLVWLILAALSFVTVSAQDQGTLRRYFEGKTVVVQIDMPGTSDGISVHPERSMPVDFHKTAQFIKTYGVALHKRESTTITGIKVKKKLIEFQLGGGGYGSFGDYLSTSMAHPTGAYYEGKSRREKDAELELKYTSNSRARQRLNEEIDDLRRDRRQNNAWASSQTAQSQEAIQADENERRLHSGSRFNIKFDGPVPKDSLTPEAIMSVLADYLDFPFAGDAGSAADVKAAPGGAVTALEKGLTLEQVERILGPATEARNEKQGSIEAMQRVYSVDGTRIETTFVGGVLVGFEISSH
jgi:hypothetical protein